MRKHRLFAFAIPVVLAAAAAGSWQAAASTGAGVGNIPQGTQTDQSYARSYLTNHVTNVFATTQRTSCYTPEVGFFANVGPNDGYSGMSQCSGANTGEALGPYASQSGSNPGFVPSTPMLVKDHSESDIRVDPTNPLHLIGQSKWIVSAEGYSHLLGFYESWDGGKTWPVQGHIPGYEGWTDNTDPVGAYDANGNFYSLILPYQFYYNSDGSHNFSTNQNKEPNPSVPAEEISLATLPARPASVAKATDWLPGTDVVAPYPDKGREPDKQWITVDTNPKSPHYNRIYAMWTVFDSLTATPWVSYADIIGTGPHHGAWSTPQELPTAGSNPQGDTYLLPHVDGNGVVYTTLTNFEPNGGFCCTSILLDKSTDGGATWTSVSRVIDEVSAPPLHYQNTSFRDGIEDTFTVGPKMANGTYPLYVSWEDYSTAHVNVILSGSFDGGRTWSAPIQVNDNANAAIDEFQPNLTAAPDGTVSVAFYDRRLACPSLGSAEAAAAGLALDKSNPYDASVPPYGAANYCVNTSIQFYTPTLAPIGHNLRLSQHSWDPQLNSPYPYGIGTAIGFIGDYFGNITSGSMDYTTSVSTYNDGSNPANRQQQVIAAVAVP